jgi:hypothetical protein
VKYISMLPLPIRTSAIYGSSSVLFMMFLGLDYALLVSPGYSYTVIWFNDTMALLDASYRVSMGQIPGKDFYTAIGPINFYLSSLGIKLGLPAGVTIAFGCLSATVIILVPGLIMMYKRFGIIPIILSLIYWWLVIAAPLGIGETYNNISWGMFYNRFGWAALFFVFLFYVEPRVKIKYAEFIDGILLSILVLFLLYCKITYGFIAVLFVSANFFVSTYNRKVSIIAGCLVIIISLFVEIFLELHAGYISSIMSAIEDRGIHRGGMWGLLSVTVNNMGILSASLISIVYAGFCGRKNIFDWVFVFCVCSVCVLLVDQNGGKVNGLPSAIAVFIVLAELLNRHNKNMALHNKEREQHHLKESLLFSVLLVVFIAEPICNRLLAVQDHYQKSTHAKKIDATPTKLSSFLVPHNQSLFLVQYFKGEGSLSENKLGQLRLLLNDTLSSHEYYLSVMDGYHLLEEQLSEESGVMVLDLANPYSYLFDIVPQDKGHPFMWSWPKDSNITIFKDITFVLEPKIPFHFRVAQDFKEHYSAFLHSNFTLLDSSNYWRLWQRNSV